MRKLIFLLVSLTIVISTFVSTTNIAYSEKGFGQQYYEYKREKINRDSSLTWGEKQEAKVKLHDETFGKPEAPEGCCGLIIIIIVAGVIIAIYSEKDKARKQKELKIKKGFKHKTNTNKKTTPDDTKKCPYCAELIKKEAIICRFCNRDVVEKIAAYDEVLNNINQGKRVACKDGNCTGTIYTNGTCGTCGKPLECVETDIEAHSILFDNVCPMCKTPKRKTDSECSKCGVIFSKVQNR
jgi:hypothetical protein